MASSVVNSNVVGHSTTDLSMLAQHLRMDAPLLFRMDSRLLHKYWRLSIETYLSNRNGSNTSVELQLQSYLNTIDQLSALNPPGIDANFHRMEWARIMHMCISYQQQQQLHRPAFLAHTPLSHSSVVGLQPAFLYPGGTHVIIKNNQTSGSTQNMSNLTGSVTSTMMNSAYEPAAAAPPSPHGYSPMTVLDRYTDISQPAAAPPSPNGYSPITGLDRDTDISDPDAAPPIPVGYSPITGLDRYTDISDSIPDCFDFKQGKYLAGILFPCPQSLLNNGRMWKYKGGGSSQKKVLVCHCGWLLQMRMVTSTKNCIRFARPTKYPLPHPEQDTDSLHSFKVTDAELKQAGVSGYLSKLHHDHIHMLLTDEPRMKPQAVMASLVKLCPNDPFLVGDGASAFTRVRLYMRYLNRNRREAEMEAGISTSFLSGAILFAERHSIFRSIPQSLAAKPTKDYSTIDSLMLALLIEDDSQLFTVPVLEEDFRELELSEEDRNTCFASIIAVSLSHIWTLKLFLELPANFQAIFVDMTTGFLSDNTHLATVGAFHLAQKQDDKSKIATKSLNLCQMLTPGEKQCVVIVVHKALIRLAARLFSSAYSPSIQVADMSSAIRHGTKYVFANIRLLPCAVHILRAPFGRGDWRKKIKKFKKFLFILLLNLRRLWQMKKSTLMRKGCMLFVQSCKDDFGEAGFGEYFEKNLGPASKCEALWNIYAGGITSLTPTHLTPNDNPSEQNYSQDKQSPAFANLNSDTFTRDAWPLLIKKDAVKARTLSTLLPARHLRHGIDQSIPHPVLGALALMDFDTDVFEINQKDLKEKYPNLPIEAEDVTCYLCNAIPRYGQPITAEFIKSNMDIVYNTEISEGDTMRLYDQHSHALNLVLRITPTVNSKYFKNATIDHFGLYCDCQHFIRGPCADVLQIQNHLGLLKPSISSHFQTIYARNPGDNRTRKRGHHARKRSVTTTTAFNSYFGMEEEQVLLPFSFIQTLTSKQLDMYLKERRRTKLTGLLGSSTPKRIKIAHLIAGTTLGAAVAHQARRNNRIPTFLDLHSLSSQTGWPPQLIVSDNNNHPYPPGYDPTRPESSSTYLVICQTTLFPTLVEAHDTTDISNSRSAVGTKLNFCLAFSYLLAPEKVLPENKMFQTLQNCEAGLSDVKTTMKAAKILNVVLEANGATQPTYDNLVVGNHTFEFELDLEVVFEAQYGAVEEKNIRLLFEHADQKGSTVSGVVCSQWRILCIFRVCTPAGRYEYQVVDTTPTFVEGRENQFGTRTVLDGISGLFRFLYRWWSYYLFEEADKDSSTSNTEATDTQPSGLSKIQRQCTVTSFFPKPSSISLQTSGVGTCTDLGEVVDTSAVEWVYVCDEDDDDSDTAAIASEEIDNDDDVTITDNEFDEAGQIESTSSTHEFPLSDESLHPSVTSVDAASGLDEIAAASDPGKIAGADESGSDTWLDDGDEPAEKVQLKAGDFVHHHQNRAAGNIQGLVGIVSRFVQDTDSPDDDKVVLTSFTVLGYWDSLRKIGTYNEETTSVTVVQGTVYSRVNDFVLDTTAAKDDWAEMTLPKTGIRARVDGLGAWMETMEASVVKEAYSQEPRHHHQTRSRKRKKEVNPPRKSIMSSQQEDVRVHVLDNGDIVVPCLLLDWQSTVLSLAGLADGPPHTLIDWLEEVDEPISDPEWPFYGNDKCLLDFGSSILGKADGISPRQAHDFISKLLALPASLVDIPSVAPISSRRSSLHSGPSFLKERDLRSCANQNWLNDEVMNLFAHCVVMRQSNQKKKACGTQESCGEVHVFNTFFFSSVSESTLDIRSALNKTKPTTFRLDSRRQKAKIDIFDKDQFRYHFIPVNLVRQHWLAVIVDVANREICMCEPLGYGLEEDDGEKMSIRRDVLQKVERYLAKAWIRMHPGNKYGQPPPVWKFRTILPNPVQFDNCSCGVLVSVMLYYLVHFTADAGTHYPLLAVRGRMEGLAKVNSQRKEAMKLIRFWIGHTVVCGRFSDDDSANMEQELEAEDDWDLSTATYAEIGTWANGIKVVGHCATCNGPVHEGNPTEGARESVVSSSTCNHFLHESCFHKGVQFSIETMTRQGRKYPKDDCPIRPLFVCPLCQTSGYWYDSNTRQVAKSGAPDTLLGWKCGANNTVEEVTCAKEWNDLCQEHGKDWRAPLHVDMIEDDKEV
jgi:hypothetical protein